MFYPFQGYMRSVIFLLESGQHVRRHEKVLLYDTVPEPNVFHLHLSKDFKTIQVRVSQFQKKTTDECQLTFTCFNVEFLFPPAPKYSLFGGLITGFYHQFSGKSILVRFHSPS